MELKLNLTAEEIQQRFPQAFKSLCQQAEEKNWLVPVSQWTWKFQWYVQGKACSFTEILENAQRKQYGDVQTVDEQLEDYRKRCHVHLQARVAPHRFVQVPLNEVPQEVVDHQRPAIQRAEDYRKQYAAMSPEEKQKETQKTLEALRQDSGFFQVRR